MSRGRPKSGSTGAGDKLVIFVHFFALFLSPPTVLIGLDHVASSRSQGQIQGHRVQGQT